jgi:hypothetical protein
MNLLRTIAAVALYGLGWTLFTLGCACGQMSARLWVAAHPEPPPDDDDDDLPDVGLIEREQPERRTLH